MRSGTDGLGGQRAACVGTGGGRSPGATGPPSTCHRVFQKGLQPPAVEVDAAADVAVDRGVGIVRLQGLDLAVEVRGLLAGGHPGVDGVPSFASGVGRTRFSGRRWVCGQLGWSVHGVEVEESVLSAPGAGHAQGLNVSVPRPLCEGLSTDTQRTPGVSGSYPSGVGIH
jgi:hypothetical protein